MGVDREATVFQTFGTPPAAPGQSPTTVSQAAGQLPRLSYRAVALLATAAPAEFTACWVTGASSKFQGSTQIQQQLPSGCVYPPKAIGGGKGTHVPHDQIGSAMTLIGKQKLPRAKLGAEKHSFEMGAVSEAERKRPPFLAGPNFR